MGRNTKWRFPKIGGITKWCIMENLIETRMIWGYPHFRKLPNGLTQAFWVLFEMYLDLAFGNPVQICSSLGVPDLCLSPRTSTFTGSTAWSPMGKHWSSYDFLPSNTGLVFNSGVSQNLKPRNAVSHFFLLKILPCVGLLKWGYPQSSS